MRNVRFVATADGKLVTVRRMSRASFVLRKQFESLNTNWFPTGVITGGRECRTTAAGGRAQGAGKRMLYVKIAICGAQRILIYRAKYEEKQKCDCYEVHIGSFKAAAVITFLGRQ